MWTGGTAGEQRGLHKNNNGSGERFIDRFQFTGFLQSIHQFKLLYTDKPKCRGVFLHL